jgi:hypothetical protein
MRLHITSSHYLSVLHRVRELVCCIEASSYCTAMHSVASVLSVYYHKVHIISLHTHCMLCNIYCLLLCALLQLRELLNFKHQALFSKIKSTAGNIRAPCYAVRTLHTITVSALHA